MTSLVKFTEPETRMVAARGRELVLSRTEFPFGMMKKFWGWTVEIELQYEVINATEIYMCKQLKLLTLFDVHFTVKKKSLKNC